MLADDLAQGQQVKGEKGWAQHGALGDSTDDVHAGICFAQGDMLGSVGQIRSEPV